MERDYIDVKRLHRLSKTDAGIALERKLLKLSEESGELAQEVLAYVGSENASKRAAGTKESVLEESVDVLNVIMDIINAVAETEEDEEFVSNIFKKKLDKWEGKTKNYSEKGGGK